MRPDSRRPRRFTTEIRPTAPTHSHTRYGNSPGSAEVTAAMPAAELTATVRT